MCCGVVALVVLGLSRFAAPPAMPPPAAPHGPVAEALARAGYEPVRLRPYRGMFMLDTTLAGKPLALLVDSGAAISTLDLSTAPTRYGLKPYGGGTVTALSVAGKQRADWAEVCGVRLGPVECPTQAWFLTDLSFALEFGKRDDNLAGDALLGADLLRYFSAWLDAETGTLWLRDPVKQEPGIQGDWQAVSVEHKGWNYTGYLAAAYTLRVTGMTVRSDAQGDVERGRLKLDTKASPKRLDFSTPNGGIRSGIYKLDGDTLVIAMQWCDGDSPERPASFDVKKNNTTVVTFRRVPAGLPPRAAP